MWTILVVPLILTKDVSPYSLPVVVDTTLHDRRRRNSVINMSTWEIGYKSMLIDIDIHLLAYQSILRTPVASAQLYSAERLLRMDRGVFPRGTGVQDR